MYMKNKIEKVYSIDFTYRIIGKYKWSFIYLIKYSCKNTLHSEYKLYIIRKYEK